MKGQGIPASSVALICSVAHLQMRPSEGVICLPRIPILIGGCENGTVTRSHPRAGRWLAHSGAQHLQETQKFVSDEIDSHGKGGHFVTEKFRHSLPLSLSNHFEQRSWVSGGWTTPSEVQPFTPESEKKIVQSIVGELNGLFDLE